MSTTKKCRKSDNSIKDEPEEDYEPGSWDCTLCTFRNPYESFKCKMCDTRKQRNSDSKSRYSPESTMSVPSSSKAAHNYPHIGDINTSDELKSTLLMRKPVPFHDSLILRNSPHKVPITVRGKTFVITEFKPKISPRGRKKMSFTAIE